MGLWHLETLVTAPTLFMGIGAFVWVPLTFLLASLVIVLAPFVAGYAYTFQQLLGCICIHGLGDGFTLSAFRTLHHTCLMGLGYLLLGQC